MVGITVQWNFPEDFEKFYCIVDDWILDMGIHPDDERRDIYDYA